MELPGPSCCPSTHRMSLPLRLPPGWPSLTVWVTVILGGLCLGTLPRTHWPSRACPPLLPALCPGGSGLQGGQKGRPAVPASYPLSLTAAAQALRAHFCSPLLCIYRCKPELARVGGGEGFRALKQTRGVRLQQRRSSGQRLDPEGGPRP